MNYCHVYKIFNYDQQTFKFVRADFVKSDTNYEYILTGDEFSVNTKDFLRVFDQATPLEIIRLKNNGLL